MGKVASLSGRARRLPPVRPPKARSPLACGGMGLCQGSGRERGGRYLLRGGALQCPGPGAQFRRGRLAQPHGLPAWPRGQRVRDVQHAHFPRRTRRGHAGAPHDHCLRGRRRHRSGRWYLPPDSPDLARFPHPRLNADDGHERRGRRLREGAGRIFSRVRSRGIHSRNRETPVRTRDETRPPRPRGLCPRRPLRGLFGAVPDQ